MKNHLHSYIPQNKSVYLTGQVSDIHENKTEEK